VGGLSASSCPTHSTFPLQRLLPRSLQTSLPPPSVFSPFLPSAGHGHTAHPGLGNCSRAPKGLLFPDAPGRVTRFRVQDDGAFAHGRKQASRLVVKRHASPVAPRQTSTHPDPHRTGKQSRSVCPCHCDLLLHRGVNPSPLLRSPAEENRACQQ